MAPTVVVVIKKLDVIRVLLAAAAAVSAVPTVSTAVAVATTIPTVALARFLLPSPIVGVIIVPPISPLIVLRSIVNMLLHH